jgi:transcriptional regulator with XRE-family HTH domain
MPREFDQVRQQLALNIRTLRRIRRLSQEQLALSADVDRTYVSQIERAVGNPSLQVLCKLGHVLGADIGLLLEAEKNKLGT